ncbi:hypothetical protein [Herbidospora mongoliensis]|uniref:hypothetical protein n=1 Tax=Herbidospora mongoliensis TaxID=688067 RepID=UPI00157E24EA|nr:hypothetical protein [Herbidospora mongoliensis]
MRRRVLIWGGIAVAMVAAIGLGVYLSRVELAEADQLASVIGVFVALAGLGVALYGLLAGRSGGGVDAAAEDSGDGQTRPNVTASGERSVAIGGDNSGIVSTGDNARNVQMNAKASGSGRVYQAGGDQTINE